MPSDEPDRQFERALARHLRSEAGVANCPESEILGAYHDRTLDFAEMTKWQQHIIRCTRCQESLALLEETDAVPADPLNQERLHDLVLRGAGMAHSKADAAVPPQIREEVFTRSSKLEETPKPIRARDISSSWLMPVGALAAAAILGISFYHFRPDHRITEPVQVAENRQVSPTVQPSVAGKAVQRPDQEKAGDTKPSELVQSKRSVVPRELDKFVKEQSKPRANAGKIAQNLDRAQDSDGESTITGTPQANPSNESQLGSPPVGSSRSAPPFPSATPRQEVSEQAAVVRPSGSAAKSLNAPAYARNVSALLVSDPSVIAPPARNVAWRVGNAGKIEMTSDGGKTWALQNSGVTFDLTTGSAPASSTCWIVGKSGTILLTTDGGNHWRLVAAPLDEDWGGVHAADAQNAVIWNVSNRKAFATSDGGRSWTPTVNE